MANDVTVSGFSPEWSKLEHFERLAIEKHQGVAPVPVGQIAKEFGLIVKVATLSVGVSGEIRPFVGQADLTYIIRINRHESKHRQRFTLAHEIAHFLLHKDLIKDGLSDTVLYRSRLSDRREAQANRLAADILMPPKLVTDWVDELGSEDMESIVSGLAEYLAVSTLAIEIRLGIGN